MMPKVEPPHPNPSPPTVNLLAQGQMRQFSPEELATKKPKSIGSLSEMNYDIPETPFNVNPFREEGLKQIVPIVDQMVKKYCAYDAAIKLIADRLADAVDEALNKEPGIPLKIDDVCAVIKVMQELHVAWEKPITEAKQKEVEAKKH
jgi:hypothetical protein